MSNTQVRRINSALVDCLKCKELLTQEEKLNANLKLLVEQLDSSVAELDSMRSLKVQQVIILTDSLNKIQEELLKAKKEIYEKDRKLTKQTNAKRAYRFTAVLLAAYESVRITLRF